MELRPAKAAFVAIDLQRGFCLPDGTLGKLGRDVSGCLVAAQRCVEMAGAARAAGLPIVWVRISHRPDYADAGVVYHHLSPHLKKFGSMRSDGPDVDFVPEVQAAIRPEDMVIEKIRYSAFFGTPLHTLLAARGIDTILVGGVTTAICVETTVRDACQHDYKTFVVRECTADLKESQHQAALDVMGFGFARVIGHNQAMDALGRDATVFERSAA
jgi:nicotinamidase-related amidase